jgi:hypothetical protein
MCEFNPKPEEWYASTIYFSHPACWALGRLDDGSEIFIPAPVRSGIASEQLAVRLKLSTKPNKRPEAIEAMALEDYYKLLDEHIPAIP